jgi:hypothetical protein
MTINKKEFVWHQGEDLPAFLLKIALEGWEIAADETYFSGPNETTYVGYKNS